MNKSRNIIKKVILLFFFVILSVPFSNRVIYGTWNVFDYPNRISFHGYRYDNNGEIMVLTGADKPQYEVSGIIDRFTGKRIYNYRENSIGAGKSVYLYLGGNRYLILRSGGGA
jgi:hypothetical protein